MKITEIKKGLSGDLYIKYIAFKQKYSPNSEEYKNFMEKYLKKENGALSLNDMMKEINTSVIISEESSQEGQYKIDIKEFLDNGGKIEQFDDLTQHKDQKVSSFKIINKDKIFAVYPLEKQLNISARINGETDESFAEMKTFIEAQVAKYDAAKVKINACKSKEELDNINFNLLD